MAYALREEIPLTQLLGARKRCDSSILRAYTSTLYRNSAPRFVGYESSVGILN